MGWEYDLETDIRYLQGIEKGEVKKSIEKNTEYVTNLLLYDKYNFDVDTISNFAGVSIKFVENIKKSLNK